MGGHRLFSWPLWSFLQPLPPWNTPQPLHENEGCLGGQASPLHGGPAAWLPCDPFHVPYLEEPCVFTIPTGESRLLLSMVPTSCLAVVSPVLSFPLSPHPREGGWASPLHRQMANLREKVPKTNLTSRRQALGPVFTYGGKTHGIYPYPDVLLVSFSVLSSLPGLINFLNEVGWFLINPEGLSGPVSSLSLWLIFVLSFKSGKSHFKYPVTLTITYLIYIFLWDQCSTPS